MTSGVAWSGGFALAVLVVLGVIGGLTASFGFAEIAALGLLNIIIVAVLRAGMAVKSLIAAAVGVLFGTVGVSSITGEVRFVFQQPQLWQGLPFGPVILGLFALPEMIDMSLAGRGASSGAARRGALALLARIPLTVVGSTALPVTFVMGFLTIGSWLALPIMLVCMGVGIIMKRCGWGWARFPLLVGFFLGPIVENNLLPARSVVDTISVLGLGQSVIVGVVARPIVLAAALTAVVLIYLSYRSAQILTKTVAAPLERASVLSALWQTGNLPVLLAVGGAMAFFVGSLGFRTIESWLFPRYAVALIIVLALLQLLFNLRGAGRDTEGAVYSRVLPGIRQAVWFGALAYVMLFAAILALAEARADRSWLIWFSSIYGLTSLVAALAIAVFYRSGNQAASLWRNQSLWLIAGVAVVAFVLTFPSSRLNAPFPVGFAYPFPVGGSFEATAIVILTALVPFVFQLRNREPSETMEPGAPEPALWPSQGVWAMTAALALFLLVSGVVGLRWAAVAFAGGIPLFLLPRGFAIPGRVAASAAAMAVVSLFVVWVDAVLHPIWPQAALIDWFGETVF